MSQPVIVIANPAARRTCRRKLDKAVRLIKARGLEVELLVTAKRGDAERYARDSVSRNPYLLLAAGGDGTFNEVINGIAGTGVPMAILPLGSVNVLAREIGVPGDVKAAVDIAVDRKTHSVSLGKITFSHNQSRYFCLMAGIGYDARTVSRLSNKIKKLSSEGAHLLSGLKTLFSWNPEALSITVNGKPSLGYSLIVCNSRKYAGDFVVAPDVSINAPCFYVFTMHGRRRRDIIRYVLGILTGRHLKLRDITYSRAENIEVKGTAHIQADGDYFGETPAAITVAPNALRLIY